MLLSVLVFILLLCFGLIFTLVRDLRNHETLPEIHHKTSSRRRMMLMPSKTRDSAAAASSAASAEALQWTKIHMMGATVPHEDKVKSSSFENLYAWDSELQCIMKNVNGKAHPWMQNRLNPVVEMPYKELKTGGEITTMSLRSKSYRCIEIVDFSDHTVSLVFPEESYKSDVPRWLNYFKRALVNKMAAYDAWFDWLQGKVGAEPRMLSFDNPLDRVNFFKTFQIILRTSAAGKRDEVLQNLSNEKVFNRVQRNLINVMKACDIHNHAQPMKLLLADLNDVVDGMLGLRNITDPEERLAGRKQYQDQLIFTQKVWENPNIWRGIFEIELELAKRNLPPNTDLEIEMMIFGSSLYDTELGHLQEIFRHDPKKLAEMSDLLKKFLHEAANVRYFGKVQDDSRLTEAYKKYEKKLTMLQKLRGKRKTKEQFLHDILENLFNKENDQM